MRNVEKSYLLALEPQCVRSQRRKLNLGKERKMPYLHSRVLGSSPTFAFVWSVMTFLCVSSRREIFSLANAMFFNFNYSALLNLRFFVHFLSLSSMNYYREEKKCCVKNYCRLIEHNGSLKEAMNGFLRKDWYLNRRPWLLFKNLYMQ